MEIVYRRSDAATGTPENPWRFRVLPKWAMVRPHAQAGATECFFHGQLGKQFLDDPAPLGTGQPMVATGVPVGQVVCRQAEQVENRGV